MAENPLPPGRRSRHRRTGWRIVLGVAIALLVFLPLQGLTRNQPLLGRQSGGTAVTELQQKLKDNGFNPGPVDGQYGPLTEYAVRQFQHSQGLVTDGVVGTHTWRAIAGQPEVTPPPATPTPPVPTPQTTPAIAKKPSPPSSGEDQDSKRFFAPDIRNITDRGELVVAMLSVDTPPFFQYDSPETPCKGDASSFVIQDGKKLCGLDVELSKGIAEELGVEVRFIRSAQKFNNVVDQVFERQADIAISKISRTLARTQKVIFSNPYLNMRQALLVNRLQFAQQAKGRRPEIVVRDLSGKIGVIASSSYVGFTKQKFPNAEAVEYPTWEESVQAARQGEILAAYRDELEIKKIILKDPDTALNFQTVVLTDTNDAIAMVLPWDSHQLQAYVNQYLETNKISYSADTLLDKYGYMFAQGDRQPSETIRLSEAKEPSR